MEYFNLDIEHIKDNMLNTFVDETFKLSDKVSENFKNSVVFNTFKENYKIELIKNKSIITHIDYFSTIIYSFQKNLNDLLNNKITFNTVDGNNIKFNDFFIYRNNFRDIEIQFEDRSVLNNVNFYTKITPDSRRNENNYIIFKNFRIHSNNDDETMEAIKSCVSKMLGNINSKLHSEVEEVFKNIILLNTILSEVNFSGFSIDDLFHGDKDYFFTDLIKILEESTDIIKLNTDLDISKKILNIKNSPSIKKTIINPI